MKKIIILLGGISSEKEISLISGEEVYKAIATVTGLSVQKYYLDENIAKFVEFLSKNKDAVVFNALHGKLYEDGKIQGLLDLMEIPYTHCGVMTSAICMNKSITKQIAKFNNIPVAKEQIITVKNFKPDDIILAYPIIIKPIDEGSSVGLFYIENKEELQKILPKIQSFNQLMAEEYIKGVECTVGVMNGKALNVTEITYTTKLFDYEAKYTTGKAKHIIPANLQENVLKQLKEFSEKLFASLNCRGVVRMDYIYSNEKCYLLEVNTQPGMTPVSLVPEQAASLNINFTDLCLEILKYATYDK
jgi:D-alanine-D-alanine ligase